MLMEQLNLTEIITFDTMIQILTTLKASPAYSHNPHHTQNSHFFQGYVEGIMKWEISVKVLV
jgi:hypothetical protein